VHLVNSGQKPPADDARLFKVHPAFCCSQHHYPLLINLRASIQTFSLAYRSLISISIAICVPVIYAGLMAVRLGNFSLYLFHVA
jgi:hypothetical protein